MLHAAGHIGQHPVAELHEGAEGRVDTPSAGVEANPMDTDRLGTENKPCRIHGVRADLPQCAVLKLSRIPNGCQILRAGPVAAGNRAHGDHLADGPVGNELARLSQVRVPSMGKPLNEHDLVTAGRIDHSLAVFRRRRQRLLAQDVLACLRRFDRPLAVHADWQGVDHGVRPGVGKLRFVRPKPPVYAVRVRRRLGLGGSA